MVSSGIRLGAWDYLKWKHVIPIVNHNDKTVVAAKLKVYSVRGPLVSNQGTNIAVSTASCNVGDTVISGSSRIVSPEDFGLLAAVGDQRLDEDSWQATVNGIFLRLVLM